MHFLARLRYTRKLHALMAFALRLFLATVEWMTRVRYHRDVHDNVPIDERTIQRL